MKVVRLSALSTGRLYALGNIPGIHFCWRLSQPHGSYWGRKDYLLLLSSSVGATTLGGFWPALQFRSTIFYLYTSLSSFSLSSSLNPLLLGQAISVLVFLLVLMNMVSIQKIQCNLKGNYTRKSKSYKKTAVNCRYTKINTHIRILQ